MRTSERLTTLFLGLFAGAAILGRPPSPGVAVGFLALAGATVLLARAAPTSPAGAFVRDLFPVATVVATFMLLEPVIVGLNPRRWDAFFAAFDARWFPSLAPAWRNAFGRAPAFTDAVYVAYVSYYALPILVALLARRRGAAAYEGAVLAILLTFWASFAGYLLLPTAGPRLSPEDEARLLGGGAVADGVRAFLRAAERTRLDAFPSGHTAVALVSAAVGARLAPRGAPALLAWAGAIVFSTVYVHVHYVVDVLAGAALGVLAVAGSPAVGRALARAGRRRDPGAGTQRADPAPRPGRPPATSRRP